MDIILVSHKRGKTWQLRLGWSQVHAWLPVVLVALGLVGLGFGIGQLTGTQTGLLPTSLAQRWNHEISLQRTELAQVRSAAEENTRALARRIAQLNAQMMRLDAAGERMVKVADLDPGEFNFQQAPAVGGPETDSMFDAAASQDPLLQALERFETRLSDRERQLRVLEDLLLAGRLQREVRPDRKSVV